MRNMQEKRHWQPIEAMGLPPGSEGEAIPDLSGPSAIVPESLTTTTTTPRKRSLSFSVFSRSSSQCSFLLMCVFLWFLLVGHTAKVNSNGIVMFVEKERSSLMSEIMEDLGVCRLLVPCDCVC